MYVPGCLMSFLWWVLRLCFLVQLAAASLVRGLIGSNSSVSVPEVLSIAGSSEKKTPYLWTYVVHARKAEVETESSPKTQGNEGWAEG